MIGLLWCNTQGSAAPFFFHYHMNLQNDDLLALGANLCQWCQTYIACNVVIRYTVDFASTANMWICKGQGLCEWRGWSSVLDDKLRLSSWDSDIHWLLALEYELQASVSQSQIAFLKTHTQNTCARAFGSEDVNHSCILSHPSQLNSYLEFMPWQFSFEKEHQHVHQRFQIVSPARGPSQMGMYTGITWCPPAQSDEAWNT